MFVTQAYHPVVWGVIVQDSLLCIHAATDEDAQETLFDHLKLESLSLMFVATYVFSVANYIHPSQISYSVCGTHICTC